MSRRLVCNQIRLAGVIAALICSAPLYAQEEAANTEQLFDLSLEELLQVEVTTFSRKAQLLSKTPAAMFVITSSDIKRSGAKSIPDLLRMVPGVQVAQVDASTWAVTARGSNGIFANKLLVLMDGRTLYGQLFSGVYWEQQDTDLSAIDRIEVIRGPGATMWGSNAMNGVINIITKKTSDTLGTYVEATAGTDLTEGVVRHGGEIGSARYRVYGKYLDRDGFAPDTGEGVLDDWDMLRAGGRIDWQYSESDAVTFSGEIYSGDIGKNQIATFPVAPFNTTFNTTRNVSGGFGLISWNHKSSDSSDFQLNVYYDQRKLTNIPPDQERNTFDVDFQQRFSPWAGHDIVWGLGYRIGNDDTMGSFTISLDPASRTQRILSGFVQDEIRLPWNNLFLTVGTKLEKNNYSQDNLEVEPNIRLSWHASDSQTLWASVARAVRVPSRIEQDGIINGAVFPPGTPANAFPIPMTLTFLGNKEIKPEEVLAYEIGYRSQPAENITFDIALFYNQYKGVRVTTAQAPVCQPSETSFTVNPACFFTAQYVELPFVMGNGGDSETYGAEVAMSYRVFDRWSLQGAYSFLKINADEMANVASSLGEDSPEHQVSLRSLWQVSGSTQLDLWMRYIGKLRAQRIDSYVTLDARYMWSLSPAFEISFVGRNLLEPEHMEFVEEFGEGFPTAVQREAYLEFRWQFD